MKAVRNFNPKAQFGQAMTEFVVVSIFFLIPMFVGMILVIQYVSLRQDAEMSARYAGWERTVWFNAPPSHRPKWMPANTFVKSDSTVSREIERRILSEATEPVLTRHERAQYDLDPFVKTRDRRGRWASLFKDDGNNNNKRIVVSRSRDNNLPGTIASNINKVIDALDRVGGFSLNTQGYYSTTVAFETIPTIFLQDFAGLRFDGLEFNRNQTILSDAWNVGGPEHNIEMVQGLMISDELDGGLGDTILDILGWIPFAKEFDSDSLIFGHVDPDEVPPQRLGRY